MGLVLLLLVSFGFSPVFGASAPKVAPEAHRAAVQQWHLDPYAPGFGITPPQRAILTYYHIYRLADMVWWLATSPDSTFADEFSELKKHPELIWAWAYGDSNDPESPFHDKEKFHVDLSLRLDEIYGGRASGEVVEKLKSDLKVWAEYYENVFATKHGQTKAVEQLFRAFEIADRVDRAMHIMSMVEFGKVMVAASKYFATKEENKSVSDNLEAHYFESYKEIWHLPPGLREVAIVEALKKRGITASSCRELTRDPVAYVHLVRALQN
jgi:hypothetical protein